MNVHVQPVANGDVTDALAWYVRHRRYRATGRLWALWRAGLDAIQANPRLYSPADDAPAGREVRIYLLPRYGYYIVYEVKATEVLVLAFAHVRRQAVHWQDRLTPDADP
jgi:plasmid stabilization system protein ParE